MIQYPSISEYEKSIKKFGGNALKLPNAYEFIPNNTVPFKVYKVASGGFAGVFKAKETNTGKLYAVRVFLNTAKPEKIQRVTQISDYLSDISEKWLCETQFYDKGININGQDFPIILMEWCNGVPLNDYVSSILSQNSKISELQEKIVELSQQLENQGIAHGDIQSGNVLVERNPLGITLKLVDYDPMFIPNLKGKPAMELGHSSFQHPKRSKNQYDNTIDRFSFWLLLTTLEAIKFDKNLWKKDMQGGFNDEDNFLFKVKDFENPNASELINRLRRLNKNSVNYYLNELLSDANTPKRKPLKLFQEEKTGIDLKKTTITPTPTKTPKLIPKPIITDVFKISSIPIGARVFYNGKKLGITPIELSVNDYHSKMIKISKGEYSKTLFLSKNQMEYNIQLEKQISIPETPKSTTLQQETSSHFSPQASPISQQNNVSQNDNQESSYGWIIVFIVLITFIILLIIASVS